MEQEYVFDVYNKIANRFNHTRAYIWKGIKKFILDIDTYSFVLDAGCGNGKHMLIRDDIVFFGIDTSRELLKICNDKGCDNLINTNILHIPYKKQIFNYCISIAVIHHLDSFDKRVTAIKELLRVCKNGGQIYLQVWSIEAFYETKNPKKFKKINNSNDFFVTWNNNSSSKSKTENIDIRFYHLFDKTEFCKTLSSIEYLCSKIDVFYEMQNWCAILHKL